MKNLGRAPALRVAQGRASTDGQARAVETAAQARNGAEAIQPRGGRNGGARNVMLAAQDAPLGSRLPGRRAPLQTIATASKEKTQASAVCAKPASTSS